MGHNDRMAKSQSGFAALGLTAEIVQAVTALGYEEPTPVQRETIPTMLSGRDLLAQAATGTGKTAAFALPMLQRIVEAGAVGRHPTAGLVLVPTRELAMQVAEAIHKYARGGTVWRRPAVRRGVDAPADSRARARREHRRRHAGSRAGPHPPADAGAGSAHACSCWTKPTRCSTWASPRIWTRSSSRRRQDRQTALFSATMPARILSIAGRHSSDPARITIAREKVAAGKVPRVRQVAYVVARPHKPAALERVLESEDPASALVFCRTRLEVDNLVEMLNAHGHGAEALHGGMEQRAAGPRHGRASATAPPICWWRPTSPRGGSTSSGSPTSSTTTCRLRRRPTSIGSAAPAAPDAEGTAITLVEPREHRLLRSMEAVAKQKIEVATVPTVADLRARRLELTRAALREQVVAGGFDQVRVVVETLAQEFDIVDVAAAAVQMVHKSMGGDGDDREIPAPSSWRPRARARDPDGEGCCGRRAGACRARVPQRPRRA